MLTRFSPFPFRPPQPPHRKPPPWAETPLSSSSASASTSRSGGRPRRNAQEGRGRERERKLKNTPPLLPLFSLFIALSVFSISADRPIERTHRSLQLQPPLSLHSLSLSSLALLFSLPRLRWVPFLSSCVFSHSPISFPMPPLSLLSLSDPQSRLRLRCPPARCLRQCRTRCVSYSYESGRKQPSQRTRLGMA